MIVPLKHVTLLCVAEEREETLAMLREMGLVHLIVESTDSEHVRDAQARLSSAQRALQVLAAARADKPVPPTLAVAHKPSEHVRHITELLALKLPALSGTAEQKVQTIHRLADLRQELVNESVRLSQEIDRFAPFGAFQPETLVQLSRAGVPVKLFRTPLHAEPRAPDGALIACVGQTPAFLFGVMAGAGHLPECCEPLGLPESSPSELEQRRQQCLSRVTKISDTLKRAADDTSELASEVLRLTDISEFAVAADNMVRHGAVAWITGWLPADQEVLVRETAEEEGWGLLIREPREGEPVPTLLRPVRALKPMLALFQALGISPAYRETDVSLPFFCFFSIFFAMLVGDGGYGALILVLLFWFRRKHPRAPRAPFILLTVFSLATIVWGALSNTWFGTHPQALATATSRWLSAPGGQGDNNMMLLCFTLGVAHLSIARIWNVCELFPDRKCLAQVGWLGVVWFMYFLAGSVVGVLTIPPFMKVVFGLSIALIALFMLRKEELKTNGADLGMLPLNIISCLGDIISYVRLFAVGLAGVKVAENFNEMATGLDLPMVVKLPCLALILLVGHALNFAMAGLSVLVHAVRLNTLEFSNHKGISWAGFAFKPFRRQTGTP
jgi:V/A-type H+-transporting ATPase subunit I